MKIDSGSTAWMLASTALVLLMTPGLAFFYGGMTRAKSTLNMMMMSWVAIVTVSIAWVLYGDSFSFAPGNGFIGGFSFLGEHGLVGRRYAGEVRQIITGSIGFDDWEWGVDLFADDPLVFKKLIYEMRFDKVSAVYAQFGQFFVGVRVPAANLKEWLAGRLV